MPEGDTVWQTARRLDSALAGRTLSRAELRVPQHATADLAGRTVVETATRGKHLLTRFEDGLTLHTHLGMEGRWSIRPGSAPWPSPRSPTRAVLATAESQALGLRLARVDLLRTKDESSIVGHLGPDLLGEDWDPQEAAQRLSSRPDRTIGEALMDQRNLAGIGNLYRAELLYLRGVLPTTEVANVDVPALVSLAYRVMRANRDRRVMRNHVYDRTGRPCARCGTTIVSGTLDSRTVWWCPTCQR